MFNPNLSDLFFWHFHPEYELVYIENASGTRHIGDHVSKYIGSDFVLIGSNIPHLNFDFGVKTDYRKVVVHLKKEFIEQTLPSVPEWLTLHKLFQKSRYGIAFGGNQAKLGQRLLQFEGLDPFQQFLQLLEILKELAELSEFELLHEQPYHIQFSNKQHIRLQEIYAFVDKNFHRKIELAEVAQVASMTKEAFCRYFKKATKYTFIEFLNRYRISQSKQFLMSGNTISDACYQSGFESLSYYNRIFKRVANENPRDFRQRMLINK
jgi:AraC-like DNA-binding protein